jgi:hypothetical protein
VAETQIAPLFPTAAQASILNCLQNFPLFNMALVKIRPEYVGVSKIAPELKGTVSLVLSRLKVVLLNIVESGEVPLVI